MGRTIRAGAALALLLALAGCGGGTDGPGVATANGAPGSGDAGATTAAASDADREERALKFVQCLREHGVDVDDPGPGGRITIKGDPSTEDTMKAAQEACQEFAPESGGDGPPPEMTKADQERFLRFAQCMREHGIPMADPDFSEGGVRMRVDGDKNSAPMDGEKERAAHEECSSLLPEEMREGPGGPDAEPAPAEPAPGGGDA